MNRRAKVLSIDAVQTMASSIMAFAEETATTLDYLDLQVKRALQWIGHDCKQYWQQEVKRGWDRVAKARAELERCLTFRKAGDHQPGCIDEKKALERAQRQLRTAEQRLQAARRWEHVIDRHVLDLTRSVAQLADWIHADFPKAAAVLERMTGALEGYVAVQPVAAGAEEAGQPAAAQPEPGVATPAEGGGPAEGEGRDRPDALESKNHETMGSDHPGDQAEAGPEGSSGGPGRGGRGLE